MNLRRRLDSLERACGARPDPGDDGEAAALMDRVLADPVASAMYFKLAERLAGTAGDVDAAIGDPESAELAGDLARFAATGIVTRRCQQ